MRIALPLLIALSVPAAVDARETQLRDYVLGRYAASSDDLGKAAGYFDSALGKQGNDPVLVRRAFDLAIAAGDEPLALRLADRLPQSDSYDTALILLRVTHALQRKDWAAVDAARTRLGNAGFAAFAAPVIEAWTVFGRGDLNAALTKLDAAQSTGFARAYILEHRAHMLAAAKRWPEAAATYTTLLVGPGASVTRVRLDAAAALQAAGHADQAAAILIGNNDPAVLAAARRLKDGKALKGDVTDAQDGVAALFVRMAADLSRENPVPTALLLARLATFLQPGSGDAALTTAEILSRSGQSAPALAVLATVRDDDPFAASARARRAVVLQASGRAQESLGLYEKAAASSGQMADWARLGEAYQAAERQADAARAFDKALALAAPAAPERWYLLFSRGATRERAGDWKAGEADLRAALALSPEQPVVLNYLGYAMLDRGQRPVEAQSLIERAAKFKPDDGFITDSLGWAYFRTQRYPEAVATLERAAAAEPDDPTINEHLGDAYWRIDRRVDARFAWKAAIDAGPEADAKARVLAKIDRGPRRGGPCGAVSLRETAHAKLNLALHVRGRRSDGYHELETIFAFCEVGDSLTGVNAEALTLTIDGPFAAGLSAGEDNLVLRAARALRAATGTTRGAALALTKMLPVASGIGGGSADAAAALRLLDRLWGTGLSRKALAGIGAGLGADLPACVHSESLRGGGRGDELVPVLTGLEGKPVLLVNPRVAVSTAAVFKAWDGVDRGPLGPGEVGRNDLETPARTLAPEIDTVLEALAKAPGVGLVRMSGSGATCFAVFEDVAACGVAAEALRNTGWWISATRLRQA